MYIDIHVLDSAYMLKDFPNCHFFPILFWKFQFNNVITDHFPGSIHCVTADM